MSFNLEAKCEGPDGVVRTYLLPRASRGITHSAQLSAGNIVQLPNGYQIEIEYVVHNWQPDSSEIAPVSYACGYGRGSLSALMVTHMKEYGFKGGREE